MAISRILGVDGQLRPTRAPVLGGAAANGLLNGLVEYWSPVAGVMKGRYAGLDLTNHNSVAFVSDGSVATGMAAVIDTQNKDLRLENNAAFNLGTGDYAFFVLASRAAGDYDSNFSWAGFQDDPVVASATRQILLGATGTPPLPYTIVYDGTNTGEADGLDDVPLSEYYLIGLWYVAATRTLSLQLENTAIYTGTCDPASANVNMTCFYLGCADGSDNYHFSGRIAFAALWKGTIPDAAGRTALNGGGAGLDYASFTN